MKVRLKVFEPLNQQCLTFEVENGTKVKEVLSRAVDEGLLSSTIMQMPHWIMIGNRLAYPDDILKEGDEEITITIMPLIAGG